jgi:hypothetical protein
MNRDAAYAAIKAAALHPNLSPLDFLLGLMRDSNLPQDLRVKAAQSALPLVSCSAPLRRRGRGTVLYGPRDIRFEERTAPSGAGDRRTRNEMIEMHAGSPAMSTARSKKYSSKFKGLINYYVRSLPAKSNQSRLNNEFLNNQRL